MKGYRTGTLLFLTAMFIFLGGFRFTAHAAGTKDEAAAGNYAETETGYNPEGEEPEGPDRAKKVLMLSENDAVIAFVLVSGPEPIDLLPLPLEGERTETIRQNREDGTEWINILHLTPEGFCMEEANCRGNDCVREGMVTMQNRDERLLGNAVVCLPHQLLLELLTREEALERFQ